MLSNSFSDFLDPLKKGILSEFKLSSSAFLTSVKTIKIKLINSQIFFNISKKLIKNRIIIDLMVKKFNKKK